jgi:predicted Zn-dependent peptidase
MVFGKYKPVESIIEEIGQVSVNSVNEYIKRYLDLNNMGTVILGAQAQNLSSWFDELDLKRGR